MEFRSLEVIVRTGTESICPGCLEEGIVNVVDATFIARAGKKGKQIYMRKNCEKHGEFEERIGREDLLERWYKWKIDGERKVTLTDSIYGCPSDCGLCSKHKSQTVLGIVDLTTRCNLSCEICFDLPERCGYVYEPSIEGIKTAMHSLRQSGAKAVQLTGGEPTILDNLVDYIKLAKSEGFHHVEVNTNAWLIPERGPEYIKELRRAGLSTLYISFEGLSEEPYEKKVGKTPAPSEVLRRKKETIEICREAEFDSVVLVPTLVKGSNDKEAWKIVEYALENSDVIRCVNFQPVSITGRVNREEREKMRITNSDLVELLEEQSNGLVKESDFYPGSFLAPVSDIASMYSGKEYFKFSYHPWCGVATFLVKKEDEWVPITRLVDVESLMRDFSNVYKSWKNSPGYLKPIKKLASVPILWRSLRRNIEDEELYKGIMNVMKKRDYSALGEFMRKIVMVGSMHFMDPYNFDLERVQRCTIHYGLPDGKVIPFCSMNSIHRDKIMRKFSIPLSEYKK